MVGEACSQANLCTQEWVAYCFTNTSPSNFMLEWRVNNYLLQANKFANVAILMFESHVFVI